MQRRIAVISLFLCLIVPLAATFAWLHVRKALVRAVVQEEIQAGMDEEALVLLKFTDTEAQLLLHWEHDREFEYLGQMYDIVETEQIGDTVYYWCWWDRAETLIREQLADLAAQLTGNLPEQHDRDQQLIEFYKKLYCNYLPELPVWFPPSGNPPAAFQERPLVGYQPPPVPPPRRG